MFSERERERKMEFKEGWKEEETEEKERKALVKPRCQRHYFLSFCKASYALDQLKPKLGAMDRIRQRHSNGNEAIQHKLILQNYSGDYRNHAAGLRHTVAVQMDLVRCLSSRDESFLHSHCS
jgi:hypothetical protein